MFWKSLEKTQIKFYHWVIKKKNLKEILYIFLEIKLFFKNKLNINNKLNKKKL